MSVTDDLRTQQRADTRRRIGRAAAAVLARQGPAHLSFPAVAEEAGVSLRTVYRHVPNKDALVAAGVTAGSEEATEAFPIGERRIGTMREFLPLLWAELYRNRELIRVQHTTPTGIALRGERLRARLAEVRSSLLIEHPELPDEDRERAAKLVTVLMSSTVLVDLVDHLGLDVAEAADLVAGGMEAVAAHPRGDR